MSSWINEASRMDSFCLTGVSLIHWGRVTHICVSKLTIIGSDNGLPPDRCQAIIWTNAAIWLIRTLGTNFSEILSEIHSFSFKKMHLKMSSAKWQPFCLGLNVLTAVEVGTWMSNDPQSFCGCNTFVLNKRRLYWYVMCHALLPLSPDKITELVEVMASC